MSVGPLGGVIVSAVGTPGAQAKGADTERALQETSNQQRQVKGEARAESAAGIGETDGQDHETNERDADGRSPWKFPARGGSSTNENGVSRAPASKDTTGQSGTQLDLSG